MTERTAYVVLGMHRSGTSSVAGTLALLGAAAPRTLMGPAQDNPKGFWESQVVTAFNDRLLAAAGSAWDDWRALDATVLADPAWAEAALAKLTPPAAIAELLAYLVTDAASCVRGSSSPSSS